MFFYRRGRTINDLRLSTYPPHMTRVICPVRLDGKERFQRGTWFRSLIRSFFSLRDSPSKNRRCCTNEDIWMILSRVWCDRRSVFRLLVKVYDWKSWYQILRKNVYCDYIAFSARLTFSSSLVISGRNLSYILIDWCYLVCRNE